MERIADRIILAMKNSETTYIDLARRTGISKSALQRYATGETEKIPLDRLESIAEATGVSAAYLMGWEAEQPTPVSESGPSSEAMRIARAYDAAEEKDRRAVRVILSVEEDAPSFAIAARGGKTIPIPKGKQLADMPDDPEADKENSRF